MHQTLRLIRLIVPLVVCFGLVPILQAVGPDTDGPIPGANNGEGVGVLVSRTSGVWNTGTGFEALNNLASGNQNTATGLRALFSDLNGGFNTATGVYSLYTNTVGFYNTATGGYSLTATSTATTTQPTVIQRSITTPKETKTTLLVMLHSIGISTATRHWPTVFKRFLITPTAAETRPSVLLRSAGNTDGNVNTAVGYVALVSNIDGR